MRDCREIIISRQGANDISGPSSTTTAPGPWDRARVCTHQSGLQLQLPPASTEKGPFRKRRQYQTGAKTGSASQIISADQLAGSPLSVTRRPEKVTGAPTTKIRTGPGDWPGATSEADLCHETPGGKGVGRDQRVLKFNLSKPVWIFWSLW